MTNNAMPSLATHSRGQLSAFSGMANFSLLLIRLCLSTVFLLSATPKLMHPSRFLHSIYQYEMVNPSLGRLIAMIVPWLEMACGIALVCSVLLGGAFAVSILLLGVFTVAQVSALYRGLEIACGCFSLGTPDQISWFSVCKNVILIGLAITGLWLMIRRSTCPSAPLIEMP